MFGQWSRGDFDTQSNRFFQSMRWCPETLRLYPFLSISPLPKNKKIKNKTCLVRQTLDPISPSKVLGKTKARHAPGSETVGVRVEIGQRLATREKVASQDVGLLLRQREVLHTGQGSKHSTPGQSMVPVSSTSAPSRSSDRAVELNRTDLTAYG